MKNTVNANRKAKANTKKNEKAIIAAAAAIAAVFTMTAGIALTALIMSPSKSEVQRTALSAAAVQTPADNIRNSEETETQKTDDAKSMAVEQTAQAVKQSAPVVEQTAPAVKQSAPAVEQTAQAVKQSAPVVEQSAQAVKQSAPVVQQTAPAVQQSAPVVEQTAQAVKQSAPVVQQTAPAVQQAVQQSAPVVEQTVQAVQQSAPVVQKSAPLYIPQGEVNDWKIHNAKDGFPIGDYFGKNNANNILNVVKLSDADYIITVTVPTGDNTAFVYNIKASANGAKMYYSGASKNAVTYDANGNIITSTLIDCAHSGTLDASDAGYTWTDTEGTTVFVPWIGF
ncbi:hypothetical protein [uncultured Ruminococcus sp.]|uniref:hypothetical protein n=1 Tax=uncultured Ruminococcus sp. TaxID=165186 RepID=UPI0025F89BF8|nr:hypothetical protein [uncultured Ruminococcus sp.]